jgi:hypothetical protein
MSNLPPRPPNVIVEKWLPYRPQKRRVVYQRASGQQAQQVRNTIIEWEAPEVEIVQQCKDLGVVDMDPEEYCRRYGNELLQSHQLPSCDCKQPAPAPAPAPAPPVLQPVPVVKSSSFCCRSQPPSPPRSPAARQQPVAIAVQHSSTVISTSTSNVNRCPVHHDGPHAPNRRRNSQTGSAFDLPELEGDLEALSAKIVFKQHF